MLHTFDQADEKDQQGCQLHNCREACQQKSEYWLGLRAQISDATTAPAPQITTDYS
jgi:hypothetical protein